MPAQFNALLFRLWHYIAITSSQEEEEEIVIVCGNLWHKKRVVYTKETLSLWVELSQSFRCTSALASTSSIKPYCFMHYFGYTHSVRSVFKKKKVQLQAFSQNHRWSFWQAFLIIKSALRRTVHVQSSGQFKGTIKCRGNIRLVATHSILKKKHTLPQICLRGLSIKWHRESPIIIYVMIYTSLKNNTKTNYTKSSCFFISNKRQISVSPPLERKKKTLSRPLCSFRF